MTAKFARLIVALVVVVQASGCAQHTALSVMPERLDFDYQVAGEAHDAVQRVMSDGGRTFIVVNGPLPSAQVPVLADGRLEAAEVRGDTVVIAGVPSQLEVRLPTGVATVRRGAPMERALEPRSTQVAAKSEPVGEFDSNLDWDRAVNSQVRQDGQVTAGSGLVQALPGVEHRAAARPGPLPLQLDELDEDLEW